MNEREMLEEQIASAQARLEVLQANEDEQATTQAAIDQAIADGYEGSPPPGEWMQDPEAEIQLDGVSVRE